MSLETAPGPSGVSPAVVTAQRFVRKMRGGSQAHLIEGDDGHWYVTKFVNNPQGRRILINELVSSLLYRALEISTPVPALVSIDREFLRDNPEVSMRARQGQIAVEAGVHFGSRYPARPGGTSIYDFLPDCMLGEVVNRDQFLGTLVADKWVSNADGPQAIFHRARIVRGDAVTSEIGWVAQMIDHGLAFQGNDWAFSDSDIQGLYCRQAVYGPNLTTADFEPWLERLLALGRDVLDRAFMEVPPDWIQGDELRFLRLLRRLYKRRTLVPQLVANSSDWLQLQGSRSPAGGICA